MSRARDLADGTFSGAFSADSPTLVVDDTNNRVGIGTASPTQALDVRNQATIGNGTDGLKFTYSTSNSSGIIDTGFTSTAVEFRTGNSSAALIDSSQNFMVGQTTASDLSAGFYIAQSGRTAITRNAGLTLRLNRLSSDGTILAFYKDGSSVGGIGTTGGGIYIGDGDTGLKFDGASDDIRPWNTSSNGARDNAIDLGDSSARFDDIFATNGTIQTSDANEKQDIAELDEAEKRVATAAKGLIRKFRWISSVEEKGDDARIHVGVIAQDLKAAFEAEGLDPGRYAMFISSTWWEADEVVPAVEEVLDEEGNVITEAQPERTETRTYDTVEEAPAGAVERTRLGVRYNQLLAFIIGAM